MFGRAFFGRRKANQRRGQSRSGAGRGHKIFRLFRRRLRNLALALLVVAATIVSLTFFVVFERLNRSIAAASAGIEVNRHFNFSGRFNLLLGVVEDFRSQTALITNLNLLTVETNSRKAALLALPLSREVSNVGSFGQNKLHSLYGLSNLGGDQDLNFVAREVEKVFAVPVDGIVLTDQRGKERLELALGGDLGWGKVKSGDFLYFLVRFKHLPEVLTALRTNLSFTTLSKIANLLLSTRFNSFEAFEVTAGFSASVFNDSRILEEGKKIIVLNGTPTPFLASTAADLIKNLGGRVLEVGNAPAGVYPQSAILAKEKDSYTLNRLAVVWGISTVRDLASFDDGQFSPYLRSDLILILGQDFVNQ